jgi:5'-nucleotidase
MKNVIIPNQKEFNRLKENFIKDGLSKIHILSDFDRTLTNAFVNGENIPSILSVLRDGSYLTPDYAQKAHELYNKYHSVEVDPNIARTEKKEIMEEWWRKHFNLLIESGLKKSDIAKIVQSEKIKFREGFSKFVDLLKKNNIPLIIMSSSGLGKESISLKLVKEGKLYDNIHIISNDFNWDKDGNAVSVKEPIIHGANKDETLINDFDEIFQSVKDRKNVILIGDSPDDVGMVEGFKYDNLLKIGFLNYLEDEKIDENLSRYKEIYDIVAVKDSSLDFLNGLLQDISS